MTRTPLLRRRPRQAPTRKIIVAVPEDVAAQVDALVQQAAALGFDVDVDQHLVAAYARLAERLKTELGDAAANAEDQHAPSRASQRDADAA
ncbi:MAG: hypothetical protein ACFCUS_03665 [Rubrimonas sp.]